MPPSHYAAALRYLSQLALYGIQPGTERLAEVLRRLGNPQAAIAAIHVAGTNGKGSTCAYCASLLGEAARVLSRRHGQHIRLGLYTSPHLQRVRERIMFSDDAQAGLRECSESELATALFAVRAAAATAPAVILTFFEALTAAAFSLWRDAGVELAVVETGLGGRLDATRLCAAQVTVVTSIGFDHMELLGQTLVEIAREKAGIFRANVPALAACDASTARAVLLAEAQRVGAPLQLYAATAQDAVPPVPPLAPELATVVPLPGAHQLRNAALAVAAVQKLPSQHPLAALLHDPVILRTGLSATSWPGRLERVWPAALPPPTSLPSDIEVWLDAAHNPEGAEALDRWLAQQPDPRPLTILFGVVAGKRVAEMTAPLGRATQVVLTCPPSPRGLPAAELQAQLLPGPAPTEVVPDWQKALHSALKKTPGGGRLLIYGSIFLVAAARGWFRQEPSDDLTIQDPGVAARQLAKATASKV